VIDTSRLTTPERQVLSDALGRYQQVMERQSIAHKSAARRNEATWRMFEAERLLAELDGR